MIPATARRVPEHTPRQVNEQIRRRTEANVLRFSQDPAGLDHRLRELDKEWDIERTLQTNFASIVLLGIGLGTTIHRRWLALPAVAAGFMVQHALQGWCPPMPVFRRFGFRTAAEIAHERQALKALRGDLRGVPGDVRRESQSSGEQAVKR